MQPKLDICTDIIACIMFVWPQRLPEDCLQASQGKLPTKFCNVFNHLMCVLCHGGSVGSPCSRDWPLISLLFLQPGELVVMRNITFYNPIHKLIKVWMPCSCHTLHQCNSVHFTKLYFCKSVTARSVFKRKFFRLLQKIEKTSSMILQCIFMTMISENFSLAFQEKKISFPNWNTY